jgi:hypothetical protein
MRLENGLAAPNPHMGHPQPTSTPVEAGGGQLRPAECREPALWPRSGRGGGLGGLTPRGPPPARRAPQARSMGLGGT